MYAASNHKHTNNHTVTRTHIKTHMEKICTTQPTFPHFGKNYRIYSMYKYIRIDVMMTVPVSCLSTVAALKQPPFPWASWSHPTDSVKPTSCCQVTMRKLEERGNWRDILTAVSSSKEINSAAFVELTLFLKCSRYFFIASSSSWTCSANLVDSQWFTPVVASEWPLPNLSAECQTWLVSFFELVWIVAQRDRFHYILIQRKSQKLKKTWFISETVRRDQLRFLIKD